VDVVAPADLDLSLTIDPADPFQLEIWLGAYQPHVIHFLRSAVRPGSRVLCAGLHVGYVAGLARVLAGPTGHVYAAEPDVNARTVAGRNLALGDQSRLAPIDVYAGGLSDQPGEIHLHESWRLGHSSFGAHHHHARDRVEAVTLGDDWLKSLGVGSIDALVLDVEGWEVHALRGLKEIIASSPRLRALVELSGWVLKAAGNTPADLIGFWRERGFEVRWASAYGPRFPFGVWGDPVAIDAGGRSGDILCLGPEIKDDA
jgi:FkbM family methyltransferase